MSMYDLLGINSSATQQDVKRAYFQLIKRFTPEKEPEAFMRIRQAYETLSDEKNRAAYDANLSRFADDAPGEVVSIIMEAERLAAKKLLADAVSLLERSKHCKHKEVQGVLCKMYICLDKKGKAVKIAEKLVETNPGNAAMLRLLAKVYTEREFVNKAQNVLKKLNELEPDNEENTSFLLFGKMDEHPIAMGRAVDEIESHGGKAPILCSRILGNCLDHIGFEKELYLTHDNSLWKDMQFAAQKLVLHTEGIPDEKRKFVRSFIKNDILNIMYIKDKYAIVPQVEQVLKNIGAEDIFETNEYKVASAGYMALQAVQVGIPKTVAALPMIRVWSQEITFDDEFAMDCKHELILLELDIMAYLQYFTPYIQRLRDEFASFFQYAADFFEMVLRSSEEKFYKEIKWRFAKINKSDSRLALYWLGEGEDFEEIDKMKEHKVPIRVTKVGRNEPCPCGSGKKYKRCCGG